MNGGMAPQWQGGNNLTDLFGMSGPGMLMGKSEVHNVRNYSATVLSN